MTKHQLKIIEKSKEIWNFEGMDTKDILVADIIKMENIPIFSGENIVVFIGFFQFEIESKFVTFQLQKTWSFQNFVQSHNQ